MEEKELKNETGAPEFTDAQYQKWLEDMMPFLKLGETLNAAIDDASLTNHRDVIYRKYRLKDWFCDKIDAYREYPGKLVNNILVKIAMDVNDKIKQDRPVSEDEMKNVRFVAEKHRSAQKYFVTRQETAPAKPIEDLLDELDAKSDTINDVTEQAKKQVVAANPPIQDQGQDGATGVVPAEPNATPPQN